MNNFLEKDFENIKKDSEVEVVLNKPNKEVAPVNGRVVENNLKELRIAEVLGMDTTIRYDQIKSVKVFDNN